MQRTLQEIRKLWEQKDNGSFASVVLCLLLTLLLPACSFSPHDDCEDEAAQTKLSIYVYAPEHPLMTRANEGNTDATEAEARVNSLQVWVFEHATGSLVAYYSPASTESLNGGDGETYQVGVSDDFAERRPHVDVYVVANVTTTSSGQQFDELTTRDELDAAVLTGSYYGLGAGMLTTAVPEGGLPMTGVLKDQPVTGERPVLRIGESYADMATVKLVRAVSKLRFVFCRVSGDDTSSLHIDGITLNANQMPESEYLFLAGPYTGRNTRIGSYMTSAAALLPEAITRVGDDIDPTEYIFREGIESPQEYEERIDAAVSAGKLSAVGAYYLRESDKQLEGRISYSVAGAAKPDAVYRMADAGDFSRNHTWLVYAYYGSSMLELNVVSVNDWTDNEETGYDPHNW